MGRKEVCGGFGYLLLICFVHPNPAWADTVPASTKVREVTSVIGSVGQIPCSVTSFDDVVMILWFKGVSGAPIYSYDARNEEIEPRHLTLKDEWGLRLYFRVWPNNKRSPALMIQDLTIQDAGLYRCRVDYRNSPTTNSGTRLKIIEPPTRLEIRDTSPSRRPISDQQTMMAGNKHSDPSVTYMGPYTEGQNVTLVCNAYGGKPLPEVRWYKNGDLVDTTYSLSGTEYAINEMTISSLSRNHSFDLYSCQANNNNETQALTHKVHLEIYLGVTSIELDVPSPMTAGSEYNIVCKTIGAYPTVRVEFWKNLKRIASRSQMKSGPDNATITTILYKPDVMDDDTLITCKAENPWVSKKASVARKTMKIKYAPVAILRFGRNRTTAFSEGESVLMECHVKANPTAHSIHWFHQGRQLSGSNDTAGIRINGMTLFISYLSHHVGGDYNCEAVNDVGKGISNTLHLVLHLSPKCVSSEATQVPLGVGETQWLTCNILAWPSDLNFYWTLNRSESGGEDGTGEIRNIRRNLTEHRLPTFSLARGSGNVTSFPSAPARISNTVPARNLKQTETNKETGYPQLSPISGEFSDYPEDQHMPHVTSQSGSDAKSSIATTLSGPSFGKDKNEQTQKDVLFGKEIHSNGEKIIFGNKASMTESFPHVVFSTSSKDASSFATSDYFNRTISSRAFTATVELTADISTTTVTGGSDDDRKRKRHVHPSSTPFGNNGKGRDAGLSGFQDKIRHTSLLSYQVRSDEDYGTVACWATNSFGNQIFPCLFHITKRDENTGGNNDRKQKERQTKGKSSTDKEGTGTNSGNLTAPLEKEILSRVGDGEVESPTPDSQQGFSKLQKTLGIVLLLILIFIAGLAGLAFSMLFVLAKRRREIRRIVIAHGSNRPRANGTFSRRRSSIRTTASVATYKKTIQGAVNKSENGSCIVEKEATFCSSDMFCVASSIGSFQEIAPEANKGEPLVSYITTEPTYPTNKSSSDAGSKDTFANNIEQDVSRPSPPIPPLAPQALMYLPNGCTSMDTSLKVQFVDQGKEITGRFKSMTPNAVQLSPTCDCEQKMVEQYFGPDEPMSLPTMANATGHDGSTSNDHSFLANMPPQEYHSHLDKDCLLSDILEQ